MMVLHLILGIFNLLMAGKMWGFIDVNNADGVSTGWTMYAWAVGNVIIGVYLIISVIGRAGSV